MTNWSVWRWIVDDQTGQLGSSRGMRRGRGLNEVIRFIWKTTWSRLCYITTVTLDPNNSHTLILPGKPPPPPVCLYLVPMSLNPREGGGGHVQSLKSVSLALALSLYTPSRAEMGRAETFVLRGRSEACWSLPSAGPWCPSDALIGSNIITNDKDRGPVFRRPETSS